MSTCAHERFMSMLVKLSRARPLYRIMQPGLQGAGLKSYSVGYIKLKFKGSLIYGV